MTLSSKGRGGPIRLNEASINRETSGMGCGAPRGGAAAEGSAVLHAAVACGSLSCPSSTSFLPWNEDMSVVLRGEECEQEVFECATG